MSRLPSGSARQGQVTEIMFYRVDGEALTGWDFCYLTAAVLAVVLSLFIVVYVITRELYKKTDDERT